MAFKCKTVKASTIKKKLSIHVTKSHPIFYMYAFQYKNIIQEFIYLVLQCRCILEDIVLHYYIFAIVYYVLYTCNVVFFLDIFRETLFDINFS